MPIDLHRLTARDMVAGFRSRDLSPVEILRAALDRIERLNPQVNAIYHLDPAALDAARASEDRWRKGAPLGPLDGVPTTVKDALNARGLPVYRGSAAGDAVIAPDDHPTVARMRDSGMVIMGKNTMCDYGILPGGISSRHGVTRNPWNLDRTTGASSSGASASVAAGFEPLSVGTDIVGSIRLPASYCGLSGLKPSQGRVPFYPLTSPSLVAGPLARDIRDAALFMDVLTRPDARDFSALPDDGQGYLAGLNGFSANGLRVRVIPELGMSAPVQPDVRAALYRAAEALQLMGAHVDYDETPPFTRADWADAETFYMTRTLSELSRQPEAEQVKPALIHGWSRRACDLSAVDYHRQYETLQALRDKTMSLMTGYDVLLLPSTPDTAFPADFAGADPDKFFESWGNTFLFNLTEQPGASIPFGLDSNALPIGVQIVGQRFADRTVLGLSDALQQVAPALPDNPLFATA